MDSTGRDWKTLEVAPNGARLMYDGEFFAVVEEGLDPWHCTTDIRSNEETARSIFAALAATPHGVWPL